MDAIFQQVTTSSDFAGIASYLKSLNPKDLREQALASTLSSGQDPLSILNAPLNTLAVLYILSVAPFSRFRIQRLIGIRQGGEAIREQCSNTAL